MTRRRRLIFAGAAFVLSLVASAALLAVVDVYLHWRTQDQAGVNVWGYRGRPVGRKQPNEIRLAMFGGSTAFGYGLPPRESIPAFLERRLNADARAGGRRFVAVNLGAPGQGAYGFLADLADYDGLGFDIAILYEGYNDLGVDGVPEGVPQRASPNRLLWRRQSPVFRLTGYYPIFPLVFQEKAMSLRFGGDLNAAYENKPVVFRPDLATRATASALGAAAEIGQSLERRIGRLSEAAPTAISTDEQCLPRWKEYCGAVREAVAWCLMRNRRVLVVTQPYVSDAHVEQQANVSAMLQARFGANRRLRYVNLGRLLNLRDRTVAYDGLHLVAAANDQVAAHLAGPVMDLVP
jgi:hypothetical protein